MFAVIERSWWSYAIFGTMLCLFSIISAWEIGEINGFTIALSSAGIFAYLVAFLVYRIDLGGIKDDDNNQKMD